ncbi:extracellular solute-binding protein [Virgibacillus sp. NKC19-3]|uniref:extracellular solute-binding protein n=1 Tax=Virgibacillus saliphilus TaxID=2831674 RepID=UPI001C9B44DA|nr:extracellular solute-binding protein [Virgibacillus sp. NKC19-3]MBY7142840.1 extracellular solute-binding protein [Virgibacillus sp. NKC19-3]
MGSKKNWLFIFIIAIPFILLAACGSDESSGDGGNEGENESGDLVIYTARDQNVVDEVIPLFEEEYPDINVEVLTMGAQDILERVRGESSNPQGDFWWGGTQSAFDLGVEEELLQPFEPEFADTIPEEYKEPEGHWYGEIILPEVIMYNTDALSEEEAPQDWDDLLDPQWEDEIIIRDVLPSGTMRTIYSAMIYDQNPEDPEAGFEWLKEFDANTANYAQDPTNLYLQLARQEGTLSVWNLQDILLQSEQQSQPFGYVMPESGAPILVDAVGVVNDAPNAENAELFAEFLFSTEIRANLADEFFQIPTRTDIEDEEQADWLKDLELNEMDLDWQIMAENEMEWMEHWDQNIKNSN